MPWRSPKARPSRAIDVRQSTTVPKTSNVRALGSRIHFSCDDHSRGKETELQPANPGCGRRRSAPAIIHSPAQASPCGPGSGKREGAVQAGGAKASASACSWGFPGFRAEAAEHHAREGRVLREPGRHRPNRDAGGSGNRETVHPGGDGGKRDGPDPVPGGQPERLPVAALEQGVLPVGASLPHRPDGVDDVAGGEGVPAGDAGLSGRTPAEAAAFLEETRAGRAVDGAVHPAAACSDSFAALTIASTSSRVMSPSAISIRSAALTCLPAVLVGDGGFEPPTPAV